MPVLSARPFDNPYTQADIPSAAAAVRSATWDQALNDLPGASLVRSFDLSFARSIKAAPKYSAAEASYFMEERGLKDEFTFDRDYNELELNILASRKRKEVARREILSRAEGSGSSAVGRFAISLAANFLDPIAVGTAFVPVIGQTKYAALLERAGSAAGRAGVRAGVGGLEGVAGAAIVEPFIAGAKAQEQADYTFADSFLNLTIGGVFGGGLHVTGGAVADAVRGRPIPSRALPDEAERVVPASTEPAGVDVGATAGPLDVPDEYLDAARRLQSAIGRSRDIDLANPAALSKIAGRQVLSVSQYVRETGGIIDDGGELSARDITARSMPGLVRKAGTKGADMDDVRQRLFDAGYFPEKRDYNEITDSEIYDAISNDLAGERRYPMEVADLVASISRERDFMDRLASQGITRGMPVDDIATRLRELDDDARAMAPPESAGEDVFSEYEQVRAHEIVDAADLPTREAAMRVLTAQAATGEALDVRPVFDRSALLDAARRIDDPDQRPLTDPSAVTRADETIAGGEPTELAAMQKQLADTEASVKALQKELGLDSDGADFELVAAVRGDIDAAKESAKQAKELTSAAQMMATCAMRHAV